MEASFDFIPPEPQQLALFSGEPRRPELEGPLGRAAATLARTRDGYLVETRPCRYGPGLIVWVSVPGADELGGRFFMWAADAAGALAEAAKTIGEHRRGTYGHTGEGDENVRKQVRR